MAMGKRGKKDQNPKIYLSSLFHVAFHADNSFLLLGRLIYYK